MWYVKGIKRDNIRKIDWFSEAFNLKKQLIINAI